MAKFWYCKQYRRADGGLHGRPAAWGMLATLARRGCVISYAISGCMRCQCLICSARGDVDAFQIKFHVSQAEYVNAEALINPTWTGTKEPMLKRFSQSWNEPWPRVCGRSS
jgi:hypothetical protein